MHDNMQSDDALVGRVLTRREVLALFGATGLAFLAGCVPGQSGIVTPTSAPAQAPTFQPTVPSAAPTSTSAPAANVAPSCIVRPELTEGPYFVDEKLNRSDIRSDPTDGSIKDGAPLDLTVRVSSMGQGSCTPLANAQVDIWHCDALGVYSDAQDPSFNTRGKKYLRGYQVTDANGAVRFTTIYPGWYQGRAVHVHFKIRTQTGHQFTSQWFFDDALSNQVYANPPYAAKGKPTMRNQDDGIFQQGGNQLLLNVTPNGQGYAATFDIGLQSA